MGSLTAKITISGDLTDEFSTVGSVAINVDETKLISFNPHTPQKPNTVLLMMPAIIKVGVFKLENPAYSGRGPEYLGVGLLHNPIGDSSNKS